MNMDTLFKWIVTKNKILKPKKCSLFEAIDALERGLKSVHHSQWLGCTPIYFAIIKTSREEFRKSKIRDWHSDKWLTLKKKIINDESCEWCGSTESLTIHHKNTSKKVEYLNVERNDVLILCRGCHNALHLGLQRCDNCGRYFNPCFSTRFSRYSRIDKYKLIFCLKCTILKDKKFRKMYRKKASPEKYPDHVHWEFDSEYKRYELVWPGLCGECELSLEFREYPKFPNLPTYCFSDECEIRICYPLHKS